MLKLDIFCEKCKTTKPHTEMPIGDFCLTCGNQTTLIYDGKKTRVEDYRMDRRRFKIGVGIIATCLIIIASVVAITIALVL